MSAYQTCGAGSLFEFIPRLDHYWRNILLYKGYQKYNEVHT